ncbi:MAG: hypothetical protein GXN93_04495 [Candidatus Diapherotrites archaeon]|nr:hypothetical protein [Candidatus Diapherotrites archaeon]
MEFPSLLRKSPRRSVEEDPEQVKTAEFWNRIKPAEFLEEDPKHALELAGKAIDSGITHAKIDEMVRRAIHAQNFQDVAIRLGASESKTIARYLIDEHTIAEKITDPQLARTLADAAPPDKIVHIIAQIDNPQLRKELLAKHKEKILSDPNAVKQLAKYPHIIEHILEAEWHADMNEDQLRKLSNAISHESPAQLAQTIANTLENDIKTPKSAKSTVILLKNIMSGAAGNPQATEGLLRVYKRIKSHVFTPEGKNIEFGKAFLQIGGEDTIAFLAKAAYQKHNRGDYRSAADIAEDAVWLAKEYLKHVNWQEISKSPNAKRRVVKYMQAIARLTDPAMYGNIDYRRRRDIKRQLRRLVEELSKHEITQHADAQYLQAIGKNLAHIHDHRIILPMVQAIAEDPTRRRHAIVVKAYIGAHTQKDHERNLLQEFLERLEEEQGTELSEQQIRNIVKAINVREYIPNELWEKYGKQ